MLEFDRGGELHTGDAEFCRDRGGEADPKCDDLGGEPNKAHLEWTVPPERRVIGADGSLSVGEELQRLLDDSLRGRCVSSKSRNVRMGCDLGGADPKIKYETKAVMMVYFSILVRDDICDTQSRENVLVAVISKKKLGKYNTSSYIYPEMEEVGMILLLVSWSVGSQDPCMQGYCAV